MKEAFQFFGLNNMRMDAEECYSFATLQQEREVKNAMVLEIHFCKRKDNTLACFKVEEAEGESYYVMLTGECSTYGKQEVDGKKPAKYPYKGIVKVIHEDQPWHTLDMSKPEDRVIYNKVMPQVCKFYKDSLEAEPTHEVTPEEKQAEISRQQALLDTLTAEDPLGEI